jgi:hypothetical protein
MVLIVDDLSENSVFLYERPQLQEKQKLKIVSACTIEKYVH